MIGGLSSEMIPHLLQSFAMDGRFSLHVRLLAGENDHHRAEAVFKALARALDAATRPDHRLGGEIPSAKGVISLTFTSIQLLRTSRYRPLMLSRPRPTADSR